MAFDSDRGVVVLFETFYCQGIVFDINPTLVFEGSTRLARAVIGN